MSGGEGWRFGVACGLLFRSGHERIQNKMMGPEAWVRRSKIFCEIGAIV